MGIPKSQKEIFILNVVISYIDNSYQRQMSLHLHSLNVILIILSYNSKVCSWTTDTSWMHSTIPLLKPNDPSHNSFDPRVTGAKKLMNETNKKKSLIGTLKLEGIKHGTMYKKMNDNLITTSLGDGYIHDERQEKSISSDAPAVLIESGPGTGKSLVLAARIAYLLQSYLCEPQNLIVLSFTNRDAKALVNKAMHILDYHNNNNNNMDESNTNTTLLGNRIWNGTVHAFAANILNKFSSSVYKFLSTKRHQSIPHTEKPYSLNILNMNQMVARVKLCLGRRTSHDQKLLYKQAMIDCNQQVTVLIQSIIRCVELWKESAMIPPLPFGKESKDIENNPYHDDQLKDNCIELSLRIGIPMSVSLVSFDLLYDYQHLHRSMGTMDSSDLSLIAYEFLQASPTILLTLRSKLQHVIIDEYQDLSVAQHRLISLLIKGVHSFDLGTNHKLLPPILLDNHTTYTYKGNHVLFTTPKLFAAGDPNQSVYSWRGACPATTVEGFRRDYPQGIIVPLSIHYRTPQSLLRSARSLFISPNHTLETEADTVSGFEISPAALKSIKNLFNVSSSTDAFDSEESALTTILGHDSSSRISIKGVWDEREESKYIISCIRRRWKQRANGVSHVIGHMNHSDTHLRKSPKIFYDESDIAILVRTSAQFAVLTEELLRSNVPFTLDDSEQRNNGERSLLPMRPVKVMTMHRAKGDEFDDVYLMGWNEGVFPHPNSVKSRRLEEERRLAYVALSRAKQRCYISYSFMQSSRYTGPRGSFKRVTEQAVPSRFIDDLLHANQNASNSVELISESFSFKELIAGRNLPEYFSKSYSIPHGYKDTKTGTKDGQQKVTHIDTIDSDLPSINSSKSLLSKIEDGFVQLVSRRKGVCKEYSLIFRSMLKELGIMRGTALVLNDKGKQKESAYALYYSNKYERSKKALSKCTALDLCQYLAFTIMNEGVSLE